MVTVSISLFNYEQYVRETLDSVLEQTLDDFELLIVDDCSTHASGTVAREWLERNQARFTSARLVQHDRNGGLHAARNMGFEAASGDYVFVLDADNVLYPRCLERCLQAIQSAGAQFAYPILEVFDGAADLMNTELWNVDRLARGNYIDAMALVDRSAWQRVGGYSSLGAPGWEDFDFWCTFAEHGFAGVLVPEILARYRLHADSMLRTVTHASADALNAEMEARHSWLSLR